MARRTALVAGGLGIAGRAIVERLEGEGDWDIVALTRRVPDFPTRARTVAVDLLDASDCRAKLAGLSAVTHVFYNAYAPQGSPAAEVGPNLAMLKNLVMALEDAAPELAHVQLMQGAKWYGVHLGPYRNPAREDDPRHMPPNFYYDQQDWLAARRVGKRWTWSALRPHLIWGPSLGSVMNLMTGLTVFALVSRELGLPLAWPGKPGLYDRAIQMTDTTMLGAAMLWAATAPAAADRPFNITNGDYTRWNRLWPVLARFFDMPTGPHRQMRLAEMMADKEGVWAALVKRHGLVPHTIADLVQWDWIDYVLANDFDQLSDLNTLRAAGFHDFMDTQLTLTDQLARLRQRRIIP
ncbi:MAG: SDR family oxidoreductase [Alphaproteobacteria bacterium]